MSWDEWVDVQMEARPMSGRANQASRTLSLFHGPWAMGLGAEQWLSQSMRPSPRLGARLGLCIACLLIHGLAVVGVPLPVGSKMVGGGPSPSLSRIRLALRTTTFLGARRPSPQSPSPPPPHAQSRSHPFPPPTRNHLLLTA
eukprot:scaffold14564_cov123-Isochrysis_galbana.AAC.5